MAIRDMYPHYTSWTIERADKEIDVLVEYGVEERGSAPSGMSGPPENYDPGSGWVFRINENAIWGDDHERVALTEAEMDKIHSWLEENHEDDDGFWDDY
jgi:hypothetical protein